MSNNVLIFRTDRVGDLILSCPTIFTIKDHLKNSKITLISSSNNHEYAKSLAVFDDVNLFPRFGLIKKIKFIYNLSKKKFDYVFILDGKNRSILSAFFLNSNCKVAIISERKINKLWNIFKIKFFNNTNSNLINLFQEALGYCEINKKITNFNFLNKKIDNKFSLKIDIENYLHIHLDEKWCSNIYIKSYNDINPKFEDIVKFIEELSLKHNILITTGLVDFKLLQDLRNNFFTQKYENIYFKKTSNKSIFFVYKPTFADIESLLRKTKTLISCHGAVTHAANSFNVKIVDIIEKNKEAWYSRYTSYLNNYNLIYRNDFYKLKKNLIESADYE